MLACAHPAFDGPVILFQNIVEVMHRSMPAILLESTLAFESLDGWLLAGAGWFASPSTLLRKRSATAASRLAERRKSIVAPVESTARYKYTHLSLTGCRSHPP